MFDKAYKEISKTTTGEADSNLAAEGDSNTIKFSQNKDNSITLEKLISKPDMPISVITTTLESVKEKSRKEIVNEARDRLPKQNEGDPAVIHNNDTGMDIVIGRQA